MSFLTLIGKTVPKAAGTADETFGIIKATDVASDISKTARLARDGSKTTRIAGKIIRRTLKGTGEIGAKQITVVKCKLKNVKSLIKKKSKVPQENTSYEGLEAFGEGWLNKGDVYDNVFEFGWKEANKPISYRIHINADPTKASVNVGSNTPKMSNVNNNSSINNYTERINTTSSRTLEAWELYCKRAATTIIK